jgi:hypothetical protein
VPSFSYPIAAIFRNTPRSPLGSWARPGTYSVRLTVDGTTLMQPLTVRLDPRIKATAADITLQHETSRAIDAALRRVAEALAAKRGSADALARVQGQLSQLFGTIEAADAAPTAQTLAAVKETLAAVDSALGR